MGRGRGKRSKAGRYSASTHEEAETAPDPGQAGTDQEVKNDHGPTPTPEVNAAVNPTAEPQVLAAQEQEPQMQAQAAAVPELDPVLERAERVARHPSSTFSAQRMEPPRVVPMMMDGREFKVAMSRIQVDAENSVWAVKLLANECDASCQCRFHRRLRRSNAVN